MNEINDELVGVIVEERKPTNVLSLWFFIANVLLWFFVPFSFMYHGYFCRLNTFIDESPVTNTYTVFKDIAHSVEVGIDGICWACSSAVVFSALLIILLHRFAGVVVWFIVTFVLIGPAGWMAAAWYGYCQAENFSIVWPITSTIITLVLALIIYSIYKHVHIVIRLFEEGGKVAQSLPWILAQPFVTLVTLAITLFFAILYFGLWSSAVADLKDELSISLWGKVAWMLVGCSSVYIRKYHIGQLDINLRDKWRYFQQCAFLHNVSMLFWIAKFFIACQHLVIAGTTTTWYFNRDKTRVTDAITKSYKYLFKYHLGSVAIGSLVITIIQVVRAMYEVIAGTVFRIIFCCWMRLIYLVLKCIDNCLIYLTKDTGTETSSKFLTFFEDFLFINKNAYIEIAIHGNGFFTSGRRAHRVLIKNAAKVATLNSVGDCVLVLGEFLVIGFAVLIGYLILQEKPDLKYIICPLVIIGIVSFVIVHVFMSAFEIIVDSVLICFCEDCVLNDGTQRPYYMSKEMMVFVNVDRRAERIKADAAVFLKKMSERRSASSFSY